MRETLIWSDDSPFLYNNQENPIITVQFLSPVKNIPQICHHWNSSLFSSMHSLKGPNFPPFPTFKSLFPLHHLLLSVALIHIPLQTLSSYFVKDMTVSAALKVEAFIVFFFFSNTLCITRPEDGMCAVTSVVWLSATLWTVACLAPLSMRFSWQEYWHGLSFPPPGDLADPGIKLQSPALQEEFFVCLFVCLFFYHWATWEAQRWYISLYFVLPARPSVMYQKPKILSNGAIRLYYLLAVFDADIY